MTITNLPSANETISPSPRQQEEVDGTQPSNSSTWSNEFLKALNTNKKLRNVISTGPDTYCAYTGNDSYNYKIAIDSTNYTATCYPLGGKWNNDYLLQRETAFVESCLKKCTSDIRPCFEPLNGGSDIDWKVLWENEPRFEPLDGGSDIDWKVSIAHALNSDRRHKHYRVRSKGRNKYVATSGSLGANFLFGGIDQYHEYEITVDPSSKTVTSHPAAPLNGFLGGIIGMEKHRRETEAVRERLEAAFPARTSSSLNQSRASTSPTAINNRSKEHEENEARLPSTTGIYIPENRDIEEAIHGTSNVSSTGKFDVVICCARVLYLYLIPNISGTHCL